MDYWPRVVFSAYGAGVVLLVTRDYDHGALFYGLWAWSWLIWPHVAYFWARRAPDPGRAELTNFHLDAFVIGLWLGYCQFLPPVILNFASGTAITALSLGGLLVFLPILGLFAGGATVWALLFGFEVQTSATLAEQVVNYAGTAFVFAGIGYISFRRMHRLSETKQAIESKNQAFASLVQIGTVAHQAADIDDLIRRTLELLDALLPGRGSGIVVLDEDRPSYSRHADFRGVDSAVHKALIDELGALPRPVTTDTIVEAAGRTFRVFPMQHRLRQSEGFLILEGAEELDTDDRNTVQLFIDQVGTALESCILLLKLRHLASTDPMTGVYNRTHFNEEYEQAARRKRGPAGVDFTVIVVDINGLKPINDEYGHEVGDALIRRGAEVLTGITRETDVLARMGGDEFVVLCNDCTAEDASRVIERIRAAESEARFTAQTRDGSAVELGLSLSIGCASTSEVDVDDVMRVADERMYVEKERHYGTPDSRR